MRIKKQTTFTLHYQQASWSIGLREVCFLRYLTIWSILRIVTSVRTKFYSAYMDLRLFFSWQSDSDTKKLQHTRFIRECIQEAVAKVNSEKKHIHIDYDEGMDGVSGSPEMLPVIEEKIKKCHIFIGDLTFINHEDFFSKIYKKVKGIKYKITPNPNVINESALFVGRTHMDYQGLHVLNTLYGNPKEDVRLMFVDKRGKRFPIGFYLDEYNDNTPKEKYAKVRKEFVSALMGAISDCADHAVFHLDADIAPFITWEKQRELSGFEGSYIRSGLDKYLEEIKNNKENLRVSGLSGLGKTRMVMEAFSDNSIRYLYAYLDCHEKNDDEIKDKIAFMFKHYKEMVLVLDNCDLSLHNSVMRLKKANRGTNPIITIFNDPEESDISYSQPLSLQKDFNDIVDRLLNRFSNFYKPEDKQKLMDFAGGIPMMAQLLGEGLREGSPLGVVNDDVLISKLLGVDKNSEDRKIMRSLSLFDFVGWEDECRGELKFVAKTKSITSIDKDNEVLLQDFDRVILKYLKRKIIERKGRLVGIRPTPIALYLISEWIEQCSDERLLEVIKALQNTDEAKPLIDSFADQFRYMGHNDRARNMLNNLLGEKSPFGNAEVINTKLGSRLFRSFAEVNPVAVTECLWRTLGGLDKTQLLGIDTGRRNIVWALDKLCFDSRCFGKAAKLMMLLGIAENEEIGNNAKSQFKGLFPVYLPATEASLEVRLKFLQDVIQIDDYKEIVLDAIGRALNTHDFILMSGAESQGNKKLVPYRPSFNSEILDYVEGCLNLLMNELRTNPIYKDKCLKILSEDFGRLCSFGCTNEVLPFIEEAAKFVDYSWDSMLDALYLVRNHKKITLSDNERDRIDNLIEHLTHHDIVSRFRNIEKRQKWEFGKKDYDLLLAESTKEYEALGKEVALSNKYDVETLKGVFSSPNILTAGFGKSIAENFDSAHQLEFLGKSIEAMGGEPKKALSIIVDFLKVVDAETFAKAIELLVSKKCYMPIYSSMGARGIFPEADYWKLLLGLVRDNNAPVSLFSQYWSYVPLSMLNDEIINQIFIDILSLDDSLPTIIQMSMLLSFGAAKQDIANTKQTLCDAIMKDVDTPIADDYWHIIHFLLMDGHRVELAKHIHERVVKFYDESSSFGTSYGIDKFYEIVMENYFEDMWNDISETMVNGQYSGFKMQDILSFMISDYDEKPSAMFEDSHKGRLLEWCERHKDNAPAILMRMYPMTKSGELPQMVLDLLDLYGDDPSVLTSLGCNMGSFSWTGSVVPLLESQRQSLLALENHKKESVRNWANSMIASYDKQIKDAKNMDAEDLHRYV